MGFPAIHTQPTLGDALMFGMMAEDLDRQHKLDELVALAWNAGQAGVVPPDEEAVAEFISELVADGWGADNSGPIVLQHDLPTPEGDEFAEWLADEEPMSTPETMWQWQRHQLESRLAGAVEDVSWWAIVELLDDSGRKGYAATIVGGGSWTGPTSDLLGLFRDQHDALAAVEEAGFTDPEQLGPPPTP